MNNTKDPSDTSNDARSINFDGPVKVIKVAGSMSEMLFKPIDKFDAWGRPMPRQYFSRRFGWCCGYQGCGFSSHGQALLTAHQLERHAQNTASRQDRLPPQPVTGESS